MSPSKIDLDEFDALIFDLGGVLLPLVPENTLVAFSELLGQEARSLYSLKKQHALFDAFERGEVPAAAFRASLIQLTGASSRPTETAFDRAWNAMLGRFPDENLRLLRTLSRKKRLFLLSNTNEIHISKFLKDYTQRHQQDFGPWHELFEVAHYSHELGMRKPEPRIFAELVSRHQLVPERTLFLDDNIDNIAAACAGGLQGRHHPTNHSLIERLDSCLLK